MNWLKLFGDELMKLYKQRLFYLNNIKSFGTKIWQLKGDFNVLVF